MLTYKIITKTLSETNVTTIRNWKLYDPVNAKSKLVSGLTGIDVKSLDTNVQDHQNVLENKIKNYLTIPKKK